MSNYDSGITMVLDSSNDPNEPTRNTETTRAAATAGTNSNEIVSTSEVIHRIEEVIQTILDALDQEEIPTLQIYRHNNNHFNPWSEDHQNGEASCIVKRFSNMSQCRSITSILMVLSYCYSLLLSNRTSTIREVYYFYVTHFRSQKECDLAIVDTANLLQVPRSALGLHASPKGWFCGCIQLYNNNNNNHQHDSNNSSNNSNNNNNNNAILDGQNLSSIQGAPITSEWLNYYHTTPSERKFTITCYTNNNSRSTASSTATNDRSFSISQQSSQQQQQPQQPQHQQQQEQQQHTRQPPPQPQQHQQQQQIGEKRERARCILVIEKEGIYNRFSENRLYDRYPCILVTGKGFPDLATRSFVHALHKELQLPVYGICDCNPYGVLVLHTYQYGSERLGMDGGYRYSVPIQWLGLRPTQILKQEEEEEEEEVPSSGQQGGGRKKLPDGVYQQLTALDYKRLEQLCDPDHMFHNNSNSNSYNNPNYSNSRRNKKYRYSRLRELQKMLSNGYKMELEAFNWLGIDYLVDWVYEILVSHDNQNNTNNTNISANINEANNGNTNDGTSSDHSIEDDDLHYRNDHNCNGSDCDGTNAGKEYSSNSSYSSAIEEEGDDDDSNSGDDDDSTTTLYII